MKKVSRNEILDLVKAFAEENIVPQNKREPKEDRVLVSGKVLGSEEIVNMVDAALDGWLTAGRFNRDFESQLAEYWGKARCISVNSGSSANLVAFSALTSPKLRNRQVTQGDEVISVAAGFPTTINPIMQHGCVPVFVDVESKTHNINVDLIEQAITEKTKAIMIAHALGNPFDIHKIREICDRHSLWMIEDCCDALGATVDGIHVGTLADICTVSFYPAHHITMGEGGAVLTDNRMLAKICESFRDWGRDCHCGPGEDNSCGKRFGWKLGLLPEGYDHKYTYSHMGFNLKISDMQAACGLAQLQKVDGFIEARRRNYTYLRGKLDGLPGLRFVESVTGANPSWFGFPVIVESDCRLGRDELVVKLNENGIDTRLFFGGNITKQPYMMDKKFRTHGELPETDLLMNSAFWLGVYPGLEEKHLDYVSKVLEELVM